MSISPPISLPESPRGWTRFLLASPPPDPPAYTKPANEGREAALSPGSVFAGQWEVLKELGAGGMARVYKVFSRVERRPYAIKVLSPPFARNTMAVARFEHEFCTLKRLSHPHIVKADSFFPAKGEERSFYTMEYLEGVPLDKLVKNGPLPIGRAVQLILQVCDAVAALHELGVLHRDIKPANIIVGRRDGQEHATLVDLGVCKWTPRYYAELEGRTPPDLRRETRAGAVLGTPGYMGASRDDDDAEFRDVFGLGATLYRVVTGRMPYKGEPEPSDVLSWQPSDKERLPETLIEALEGALDPATKSRFQSIPEFREALDLVVEELALQAPPESSHDTAEAETRRPRRSRSRVLLLGIGLGLGLGLGLGISIGLGLGHGEGDNNTPKDAARAADGADAANVAAPSVADSTDPADPTEARNPAGIPNLARTTSKPDLADSTELSLGSAASCVSPLTRQETFVDLHIDDDGRVAGVVPGSGVDPLTVLCLKKKLEGQIAFSGGKSTHRVPLASLLASEDEHDDG